MSLETILIVLKMGIKCLLIVLKMSQKTTGCPKKKDLQGFLRKAGLYFPKMFLNYKLQPICTSIEKNSSYIKKLQTRQFSQ